MTLQLKKANIAMASILMLTLTACAANDNNQVHRGTGNTANTINIPRNVSNSGLYNTPQNVSTGDLERPLSNMNVDNRNPINMTTESLPMNNGFITLDQNSYSTTTPSHQFPHTQRVKNGQYWYYTFDPEMKRPQMTLLNPRAPMPVSPAKQQTTRGTAGINKLALQVVDLTNKERRKNGLPALTTDVSLSNVAQTKTNDMNRKKYFSHTSPTYGSPFDMMRDFGVTYQTAGENIAMGQITAQQVVTSWMNSEGHRKNILNPHFTRIGVGYTSTGNYWSQMFIGK